MSEARLYVLIGKSASGKDTVLNALVNAGVKRKLTHTTRPMREGERQGVEYHFETNETHEQAKELNRILEERSYDTARGVWYYWTDTDPIEETAVTVSTVDGFIALRNFYGAEKIIPVYLNVENIIRMERLYEREKRQPVPDYEEILRRFIADEKDFSEDRLRDAGISRKFPCLTDDDINNIITFIQS